MSDQRPQALDDLRLKARTLLSLSEPADALYAYYVFYHDPQRTRLYVHEDEDGHADGLAIICQTGQRLFQPTVALRTPNARAAVDLLDQALAPGRPYTLITTPDLRDVVKEVAIIQEPDVNHIYRLDLSRFESAMNVLVVAEQGLGGLPRFVIRSHGRVAAEAGINWTFSHFAEVFVRTEPAAQGRGWGQAVLGACTTWVVRAAKQPLYVVSESNETSLALARKLGYVDTGAREFTATIARQS